MPSAETAGFGRVSYGANWEKPPQHDPGIGDLAREMPPTDRFTGFGWKRAVAAESRRPWSEPEVQTMRVRSQLRKATEGLIWQLGQTPNAVADRLTFYGIRGIRNRSNECALSRYLQLLSGTDPRITRIEVHRRSVRVGLAGWRRPLTISLPPAARSFVEAFDAGCYPQLMAVPGASETVPDTRTPLNHRVTSSGEWIAGWQPESR